MTIGHSEITRCKFCCSLIYKMPFNRIDFLLFLVLFVQRFFQLPVFPIDVPWYSCMCAPSPKINKKDMEHQYQISNHSKPRQSDITMYDSWRLLYCTTWSSNSREICKIVVFNAKFLDSRCIARLKCVSFWGQESKVYNCSFTLTAIEFMA